MSSQPKNILILGSTGGGKSSTINTIMGSVQACVGKRMVACTTDITEYVSSKHNIRIIDCPGYNDNRFGKEKIVEVMNDLRKLIFPLEGISSYQVDAFLLVIKCSPRAQTLVDDLDQFTSMFGEIALRTLEFVFIFTDDIDPDEEVPTEDEILQEISEMKIVVDLMKEAGRGEPSRDWLVPWSNKRPRDNQVFELLGKISTLQPYTNEIFLTARIEIDQMLRDKYKKEIESYEKKYLEMREADREALKKEQEEGFANMQKRFDAEVQKNKQVAEDTIRHYKDMIERGLAQQRDEATEQTLSSIVSTLPGIISRASGALTQSQLVSAALNPRSSNPPSNPRQNLELKSTFQLPRPQTGPPQPKSFNLIQNPQIKHTGKPKGPSPIFQQNFDSEPRISINNLQDPTLSYLLKHSGQSMSSFERQNPLLPNFKPQYNCPSFQSKNERLLSSFQSPTPAAKLRPIFEVQPKIINQSSPPPPMMNLLNSVPTFKSQPDISLSSFMSNLQDPYSSYLSSKPQNQGLFKNFMEK